MTWDKFKGQFSWKRRMEPKEVKDLAAEIFSNLKNGKEYDNDYSYERLANFIDHILKSSSYKNFNMLFNAQLKDHNLMTKTVYYKPITVDNADKVKFKENIDVPYNKNTMSSEEFISREEPNNSGLFPMISNLDDKEPIIKEPDEEQQEEKKKNTKPKSSKSGVSRPAKSTKEQQEAIKFKKIAEAFKGPSITEEYEKLITNIAKDKSLMSLSKEQFQDYLKSKLGADDKNVDVITEAVVAKRAALLDKNQLKREQLTELDVANLQEQSQRDFERKMRDQNLRYILPAMLEKRDRLIVNRLNPELLKCGY